ncbi:hypothetical protein CC1G_12608 [Coprinopsis cinerea okayama7|uniref:Uncharacterized protein n=1 Tax=Coprinopsis cinerea (strain Okayama-7 / 130 / ATCC MYA-4618 / FGSC 9003) TaxID=240176 RepID=A8NP73_COPC7|nr:hypothetical protein CC1G_12608 [Coprinopsis cinerea okayama7\|eukprot:XP_001835280.2 hypothetical protein CC1G_12608 [Coprinopsis cinerea okayama7\
MTSQIASPLPIEFSNLITCIPGDGTVVFRMIAYPLGVDGAPVPPEALEEYAKMYSFDLPLCVHGETTTVELSDLQGPPNCSVIIRCPRDEEDRCAYNVNLSTLLASKDLVCGYYHPRQHAARWSNESDTEDGPDPPSSDDSLRSFIVSDSDSVRGRDSDDYHSDSMPELVSLSESSDSAEFTSASVSDTESAVGELSQSSSDYEDQSQDGSDRSDFAAQPSHLAGHSVAFVQYRWASKAFFHLNIYGLVGRIGNDKCTSQLGPGGGGFQTLDSKQFVSLGTRLVVESYGPIGGHIEAETANSQNNLVVESYGPIGGGTEVGTTNSQAHVVHSNLGEPSANPPDLNKRSSRTRQLVVAADHGYPIPGLKSGARILQPIEASA